MSELQSSLQRRNPIFTSYNVCTVHWRMLSTLRLALHWRGYPVYIAGLSRVHCGVLIVYSLRFEAVEIDL